MPDSHGSLAVMEDGLGVLHDARKLTAKDNTLNESMAEMARIIAPMGQELRSVHLRSQRDSSCDVLSRLAEGHQIPAKLGKAIRTIRKPMEFQMLGTQLVSQADASVLVASAE